MSQTYTALLIDDHPLIVKAYKSALKYVSKKGEAYTFVIDTANNCDTAFSKIQEVSNTDSIDLIFLDISLPASKDGKIISGEELGIIIREELSNAKIIVATSFNDNIRLSSILKSVNPDGFLIKNDLTPSVLAEAIETVIKEPPYYSKTVLKFLRKISANDFILDSVDRKLLFELSKGAKMGELPDVLLMSIGALERRKRILKEIFNVAGESDRTLIQAAEDAGFV